MSVKLDVALESTGTAFRVYPQPNFLPAFAQPEVIRVSVPPNQIQPGPSDDRMFVVDAINKFPYGDDEGPPYNGPANPPSAPGPTGHFDHLQPGTSEFSSAHMYAVCRRVLDIWEDYFDHRIPWHFEDNFSRLLLIPRVRWANAQSGFGFLEFGFPRRPFPQSGLDLAHPYCENFDVLAHELGHSIIFSQVGFPNQFSATEEYGGFHESAGDLVAILSSIHFQSVVSHLLDNTRGNLFTVNELERVGELSANDQIRAAFNDLRMSDVIPEGNPPRREPHDLSQPLTGAIFDIFVEVFQKELVRKNLISQALADRSFNEGNSAADDEQIQNEFDQAYAGHDAGFRSALLTARDYLGQLLAKTWENLSPHFLAYAGIARALLDADRGLSNGLHQDAIRRCVTWRQISMMSNPFAAKHHRFIHDME